MSGNVLGGLNAESRAFFGGDVWKGEFRYFFYPSLIDSEEEDSSASEVEEEEKDVLAETQEEEEGVVEKTSEESEKEEEELNEIAENGVCGELTNLSRPFCEISNFGGDSKFYDLDGHFSSIHGIRTEQGWNSAWIMAMSCYKSPISEFSGLNRLIPSLHHSFVIFTIQYGDINYLLDDIDPIVHYLSVEKNSDFIDIQWSDDKVMLIDRFHGFQRSSVSVVREEEKLPEVRKVSELVSYLVHDMPALKNTYNLLSRNCQHFIATVYKFCTGTAPENDIISSFIR